jgi:hypothetical protein
MPLLGPASILLSFDIAPEAIAEHDDWHTHEHMPERLSIPGFLRGSRWTAIRGEPRYMVLYELAEPGTLTSAAYLQRLNNPTPWTSKMMPHYRGMRRSLCSVVASRGVGIGGFARLLVFNDANEDAAMWLIDEILPTLPSQRGIASAHLLQPTVSAPMTREQGLRGTDAAGYSALLVDGV